MAILLNLVKSPPPPYLAAGSPAPFCPHTNHPDVSRDHTISPSCPSVRWPADVLEVNERPELHGVLSNET